MQKILTRFMQYLAGWLAIFSFFMANCASGQEINSTLWKLEKGNQPVSYLVGTVHINQANYSLAPKLVKALGQSKKLFTEVLLPVDEQLSTSLGYVQFINLMLDMANSKNLHDALGQDLHRVAKNFAKDKQELAVFYSALDYMHPWALAMLFTSLTPPGYQLEKGTDWQLTRLARQNKIELGQLETPAAAIKVFADMPLVQSKYFIQYCIDNFKLIQQETIDIINTYNKSDFQGLLAALDEKQLLKNIDQQHQAYIKDLMFNKLLTQRNNEWMKIILQQLPEQPTMLAVGFAHLVGDSGLIQLLRANGYKVTALLN